MTLRPLALAVLTGVAAQGCVAYNEQCTALVENPTERIAFIAQDIYLDRPNARHAANALGQVVADAFVDAFSTTSAPADLAVLNGGALRSEGICGQSRTTLRKGSLTNGGLHEIMLFENLVVAVDVTEPEVIAMFEHSLERLVSTGNQISSPAGQFLQVSKEVSFEADCSKAPGTRLTSLTIKGVAVPLPMGNTTRKWRVAASAFVFGGGDGYSMLVAPAKDPDRNPAQAQRFGGVDSNVAADYLRRTFNADAASGVKLDGGRAKLNNCAVPGPPTG
ncbi:MAG: 5'-nucleotidase C-terminal domain-containing protein [Myxococcaceae bacterium]|nr:5'-nucleotidase C-terminal domain-containing protein [Myxococcaceae bacterium]